MSREIKFRAWLKDEKKMVKVSELRDIDIDIKSDQNVIYFDFEKQEYCCKGFDEVELMQYTGLKDKNGVKIFDGDIVKTTRIFKGKVLELIKYVEFKNGSFLLKSLQEESPMYLYKEFELEVIGNIWEHEHLLGEQNDS